MEKTVDHPKPWLRYVDADDIADETLELDGMKVRNDAGDKLGTVEGLIVDSESGRTYYVVVDAGGWFKSKHFLMPIGQAHLDEDRDALVVNLTRDQINGFPGFDLDEFDRLTESDVNRINAETLAIVEPAYSAEAVERYDAAWARPSFREPDWWAGEPLLGRDTSRAAAASYAEPMAMAHDDESPHFAGRAQPGDVLGIETGGEKTHIGETAADENKRRDSVIESDRKDKT
jgi:hypothetical protein